MGAFADWWPVTYDFGLVKSEIDVVTATWVKMYADGGVPDPTISVSGSLNDCLGRLEPLSYPPTKELFLSTTFGWTAFFRNSPRGSDPFLPMSKLSRALGVTALRACVTPASALYQGVILEVYDRPDAGADEYGYRRSIAALNDGGRWVFTQSGTPFDFEDSTQYGARRKRDRFTPDMLFSYLKALGIPGLSDETLQPNGRCSGMLLSHHRLSSTPHYSLEEAKALDYWNHHKTT
jgi:hypothetical protein